MAITVNFTPNVATFMQGDAPITVSMSGTPTAGYASYYWESDGGTFSDKFGSSPVFTPFNATKTATVVGNRVKNFLTGIVTPGNFSSYGAYGGLQKTGGSSSAWDSANTDGPVLGGNAAFEVQIQETNTEKAAGFLTNSVYSNPDLTGSNSFSLCWHFSSNGTALAKKQGLILSNPVFYKVGDLFRVQVEGGTSSFYLNGTRIASTTTPSGTLYGAASFKTVGSIINNPVFMSDYVNNRGARTIQINGIFPEQPNYAYELTSDNNTLSSVAEDGTATFRVKGALKKTLALQFTERPYSEYLNIYNFWKFHQKHEKFYYQDLVFDDTYLVRFDTGLRVNVIGPNVITVSFNLKEA